MNRTDENRPEMNDSQTPDQESSVRIKKFKIPRRAAILVIFFSLTLPIMISFQNCGMSYTTEEASFEVPPPVEDDPAPGYSPGAPPSEKQVLNDLPDFTLASTPLDFSPRIVIGSGTTCLAPKERLYCFGDNASLKGANTLNGSLLKTAQDAHLFNDPIFLNTEQNISKLAAGSDHFCAQMNTGKIICWGQNDKKQLGRDNTTSYDPALLDTSTLPSDFSPQSIASGAGMNFALSSGKLYCWGDCAGFTSSSPALTPTLITAEFPDSVVSLDVRNDHSNKKICVVLANSKAMCLSANGVPEYVPNPSSPAEPAQGIRQVVMGPSHECYLIHDAVLCRGDNTYGQLGDGSGRANSENLVLTYGLGKGQGIRQIASAGNTTCGINKDELIYCWGSNFKGTLGTGETCPSVNETCFKDAPQIVMHSDKFKNQQLTVREIAGGDVTSPGQPTTGRFCLLFNDGSTACWGQRYLGDDRDSYGENADSFASSLKNVQFGEQPNQSDPSAPITDEQFTTRGGPTDAPITAPEEAERLPQTQNTTVPVDMEQRMTRTQRMTCAWPDVSMYCWGDNGGASPGYLNGSQSYYNKVTKVPTNSDLLNNSEHLHQNQKFKSVFQSSTGAMCALMTTGKVRCWNSSKIWYQDPFGSDSSKIKPDQVAVLSDSNWFILVNSGVKYWNSGSTTAPAWVSGMTDSESVKVHAIAASPGATKACALLKDWTAKCFNNSSGTNQKVKNPEDTSQALTGIRQIAVGYQHQCFLVGDAVACMGKNDKGQLGNKTTMDSETNVPVIVHTLGAGANVKFIAASGNTTCAVKTDQSVYCWGSNQDGALGIGLSPDCTGSNSSAANCYSATPRLVTSTDKIPSDLTVEEIQILGDNSQTAMTANARQVCIRLSNKGISCWGAMYLGNTTSDASNKPTPVKFDQANLPADPNAGVPDNTNQSFQQGNGVNDGALGAGTQAASVPRNSADPTPTPLPIQSRISISDDSTCVFPDKKMYCFGKNYSNGYSLGSETHKGVSQTRPIEADILNNSEHLKDSQYFVQMSATDRLESGRCVLMSNGKIRCWKTDQVYYMNSYWTSDYPVKQIAMTTASGGGGLNYTWLLSNGTLMIWKPPVGGSNTSNPTSYNNNYSGNIEAISGSWWDTPPCALYKDTTARCNNKIILDPENRGQSLTGIKQVAQGAGADGGNYCLLVHDGVLCGGKNNYGELGDGTTMASSSYEVPVIPKGLSSGVKMIAAGGGSWLSATYCAVKTDNSVYCWGSNLGGALGIGVDYNGCLSLNSDDPKQKELGCRSLEPRLVSSTNNIGSTGKSIVEISISTGRDNSRSVCILLSDKSMSCWGNNYLGNGSSTGSNVPVAVEFP